ncbi:MAG TPA: Holliday junction resolvase RuvX [Acholeplasmataceae bacterium]|jgi:putative Holliday junction resolvase|nr:Holliday junction resolvase RuvX [Acholeplasmataceae bacterium]
MRILGLDLGTKTVGMAISDVTATIATPLGTVRIPENDLESALQAVLKVVAEYDIKKIVMGLPRHMSGDMGTLAEYCRSFAKMLSESSALEVIMIDERLTSRIAERVMLAADVSRKKRKQNVDKLAAAVILQSYLDANINKQKGV